MADSVLTPNLHLINGLVLQLEKNAPINATFARHACAALVSRSLLAVTAGAQQHATAADTCRRLLDAIGKLVNHESFEQQALVVQVLASCIHACDSINLLERAVLWGSQLTEAIKRSGAATAAADKAEPAAGAVALTQAACSAAAVLFGRLQAHIELPGVRREATSIVPKLLPQLLTVLQNSQQLPSSCQAAALQLLSALLSCTPSAFRSTALTIERALQQMVLAAATTSAGATAAAVAGKQQVLAQAAACVALLPAVQGDALSWSETARRLLSSSHDVLDYLLMGLESRPTDPQYRAYLAPITADGQQQQHKEAAATLAAGWLPTMPWQQQQQQEAAAASAAKRQTVPAKLLLGMFITSLQQLLQKPFITPVPVPSYSLALLAARLLQFDAGAAVSAGAVAGSSTMYQEVLVLQPQLQQAGWQLLQLVVEVGGQQLQLQGMLLRLVRQGLRTVQLSGRAALLLHPASTRCCVYTTASCVLQATGLAGVRALAADAMGCAVLELYGAAATAADGGVAGRAVTAANKGSSGSYRPTKRPKTAGGASGNDLEQFDPAASVAAISAVGDDASRMLVSPAADLAAQTAVLQMLTSLLDAGGQLMPSTVRAHTDAAVFHIAQTTAAAALRLQQQPALSSITSVGCGSSTCSSALSTLQVAAYKALLASILAPCNHRPPFLSQAVLLFRQGRSSSNAAVAAVCQAAAVQCEALLHPHATAMSSVRQYMGMDAVPQLNKPRMWSAIEATSAAGQAGLLTAKPADAQEDKQAASQQDKAAGAGSSAAAAAGGITGVDAGGTAGLVVVGYPVNMPVTQQQQQQLQLQVRAVTPVMQSAGVHTTATTAAAAGGEEAHMREVQQQQVQHEEQPQAVQATALVHQETVQGGIVTAPSDPSHGSWVPALQSAAHTTTAALAPTPATAAATGILSAAGAGLKLTTAAFDNESSDSEGPLPEIDSGDGSESEEDE